jgi:hypothetical protein
VTRDDPASMCVEGTEVPVQSKKNVGFLGLEHPVTAL